MRQMHQTLMPLIDTNLLILHPDPDSAGKRHNLCTVFLWFSMYFCHFELGFTWLYVLPGHLTQASILSGSSSLRRLPWTFSATSAKSCCCLNPQIPRCLVQQTGGRTLSCDLWRMMGNLHARESNNRNSSLCNWVAPLDQDLQPLIEIVVENGFPRVRRASP